ncbi:collagenase-like [Cydia pomonella]|uniref:collagenase-like n=1 Tax=Cydia pomonella TaxID=82600 RepID=UPI002ADE144C|nr:collagenase-like [Cydia pomonella]
MELVVVCALVGLVGGSVGPYVDLDYHNHVGIPAAKRIKAHELEMHKSVRITGGAPAGIGQYPFFGGILITMIDDSQSVCGSTLLSNTRAVTAAHCWRTTFSQAKLFTVIYDSIFLFSGGTRVSTSDVELHEDYNATTILNDIAIIKHAWVDFNSAIHSIPIAIGENLYVGRWAQAIGFGRTSDSPIIPHDRFLSHVFVQVITNEECGQTYGSAVTNSTLCVATTGGRSTCSGDSGGPLVVDNKLIGVTSFGHAGDCTRNNPTGFSRVTCFAAWINDRL